MPTFTRYMEEGIIKEAVMEKPKLERELEVWYHGSQRIRRYQEESNDQ